jgi:hypothetical protein
MKTLIEPGDIVSVSFHGAQITLCHKAKVISIPRATGDSWIFEQEDGAIHYVSEGCTVTLLSKASDEFLKGIASMTIPSQK